MLDFVGSGSIGCFLYKFSDFSNPLAYPTTIEPKSGRTALMLAVLYGETDVVEELLQHSVDDTVQDHQGRTAFFFAQHLRRPLLVETLLRHPSLPYDFVQSRLS